MNQTDLKAKPADGATSDELLVRLAQQGNLEAFTSLYERYLPVVYKRVRYVIPEQDVEDVTQEIFIAVLKSLKNFKGDAQFSTWLRTLTKRRVADFYRRRNPTKAMLELDDDEMDQLMSETAASSNSTLDDQIVLRRALQSLSEDHQEILLLRFAEGLQFNEIARLRGQSLEAVKSLFRRSVEALRKQMGASHA